MKVQIKGDTRIYEAWKWNGTEFPPEGWENFGFLEDDNGYDLESCSDDFIVDPTHRRGKMRQDDWALMSDTGAFALCSPEWFRANINKVEPYTIVPVIQKLIDEKRNKADWMSFFSKEVDSNLTKTRMVKFPDWMTDPMERRMYFTNESYRKAAEEAAATLLDKLGIE